MKNRIAIIDMGTNTFHLLVAEFEGHTYKIIYRDSSAVKIGKGGITNGFITEEGATRALAAIKKFKATVDTLLVQKTLAFGTSALRVAKNGEEIIQKIITETGIRTRIISGVEEATYIYEGVRSAMTIDQKSLIVDIGGGSVEFIIGNEKEVFWKQSFEIGGQRLLEKYQKHDPILPDEISALNDFFSKSLHSLTIAMAEHQPLVLIGSSGTFDTLSEIHCIRNFREWRAAPETPLTINSFHEIFNEIKIKDRGERLLIPGMIEMRVDMIVVACCLINFLLANFTFDKIRVSSYSLKEGVLASLIKNSIGQ
jgi:exopolyphosphatase / guanosine-5'-triphosphate,3'-diphosphate pyrophosphatase